MNHGFSFPNQPDHDPIFRERAEVLVGIANPAEETIFFTASCPQISKQNTKHQFVNGSIRSKDSSFKIWDHIEAPSAPNSDEELQSFNQEISWRCWSVWATRGPRDERWWDTKMLAWSLLFWSICTKLSKNTRRRPVYYPIFVVSKGVPKSHPNDFSAMATKSPGKLLRVEAGGDLWCRAVLVWTLQETRYLMIVFFPMVSATWFYL